LCWSLPAEVFPPQSQAAHLSRKNPIFIAFMAVSFIFYPFHTLANREDERTSMSSLCWLLLIFLMILKKLAIESLDNGGKFLCELRSFLLEYQGEMLNHVHKALCTWGCLESLGK
jgi:hypothetical protein